MIQLVARVGMSKWRGCPGEADGLWDRQLHLVLCNERWHCLWADVFEVVRCALGEASGLFGASYKQASGCRILRCDRVFALGRGPSLPSTSGAGESWRYFRPSHGCPGSVTLLPWLRDAAELILEWHLWTR